MAKKNLSKLSSNFIDQTETPPIFLPIASGALPETDFVPHGNPDNTDLHDNTGNTLNTKKTSNTSNIGKTCKKSNAGNTHNTDNTQKIGIAKTYKFSTDVIEKINRIAYWQRRLVQDVVNDALRAYISTVPEEDLREKPTR